jgi:hypothetical protein
MPVSVIHPIQLNGKEGRKTVEKVFNSLDKKFLFPFPFFALSSYTKVLN